jgi:hypothetical protein
MELRIALRFMAFMLGASATAVSQNGSVLKYGTASATGVAGSYTISVSEAAVLTESRMRLPPMPEYHGIRDIASRTLYMQGNPPASYVIDDRTKSYAAAKDEPKKIRQWSVAKLGEEKLSGYRTVHIKATSGQDWAEAWLTKDVAGFEKLCSALTISGKMLDGNLYSAIKAAGFDGLPVKILWHGKKRDSERSMNLLAVERKDFPKKTFALPEGYRKTEKSLVLQLKTPEELSEMSPKDRKSYSDEIKKSTSKK